MLMFRSRRNTLVKRLWKARLGGSDEEGREVRKWLLRRLAEDQLDILVTAIESRGGGSADCLLIEPVEECTSPELLCCQIWRWPDLESIKQLKKLPMCKSGVGSTCCNPYHWSRLCLPGMYTLNRLFYLLIF
ncbi:hypothetical protein O3M35_010641 [Rhynocoris fuscipes]|uniref:MH1 domain-containing protein n=1 Tax=Rhynocoris fuscipes TaxID=488301 RepID=A0AAW1D5T1_9HEMI